MCDGISRSTLTSVQQGHEDRLTDGVRRVLLACGDECPERSEAEALSGCKFGLKAHMSGLSGVPAPAGFLVLSRELLFASSLLKGRP